MTHCLGASSRVSAPYVLLRMPRGDVLAQSGHINGDMLTKYGAAAVSVPVLPPACPRTYMHTAAAATTTTTITTTTTTTNCRGCRFARLWLSNSFHGVACFLLRIRNT